VSWVAKRMLAEFNKSFPESKRLATEPARAVGINYAAISTVLAGILYLLPIPPEVIQAILVVAAFALPLIVSHRIRGKVWSPASVKLVMDQAVEAVRDSERIKRRLKIPGPEVADVQFPPDVTRNVEGP
jgi:hypothetical protein